MYEILKVIGENTKLVMKDGSIYILKKVFSQDIPIYKKLQKIDNENVAKIVEINLIDNDFYILEEYVQGLTLYEYIEKYGVLDDITVKNIALDICNGLESIHNLSIVHRDINPNNIIIDKNKKAVIIDFDISRCEKQGKTFDTQILGTQGYAAPEQYGFSQTTPKADIYAVGVLINYMKTACIPNVKMTQGVFGKIVKKCTQIDENNRYADVKSLSSSISGRVSVLQFVKKIPGFRAGIWWHSLIAALYYIAVIFMIYICFDIGNNTKESIFYFLFFLFCFVFPVPVLTNQGNWLNKLKFSKNQTRPYQWAIQIILSVILCIIGVAFIYYI